MAGGLLMFARELNRIRIDLSITPKGPILIRSGRQGVDPTRPDLEWVRTWLGDQRTVYLPGSSLKGVMRAHAERLLTTEGIAITPTFERREGAPNQKTPGDEAFRKTCPLGRTFGTLGMKGRVSVSDFIPGGHAEPGSPEREEQLRLANRTEPRNGVGIDRLLGSVHGGALFDQEVVVGGRFDGQVFFRNVQLYQLALLLLVLRDLDEGYVQLGSGTSRGNGWVKAEIRKIVIESRAVAGSEGKLLGAGALSPESKAYNLFAGDEMDLPGVAATERMSWRRLELTEKAIDPLAEALLAGPWSRFLAEAQRRRDGWAA
jgi:CRISPR/Cas system CSM-associated protein Csm3 (group 7 of RAMP superfamily)